MSSLTSRMSLYKPASGENVNVTTDLDNNLDSIDLNMNFRTCTSSTRPSTRWDGLTIHETDTRKSYVWNATPAVSGWYQIFTAEAPLSAINLTGSATGSQNVTSNVTGDSNQRFQVRADGRLEWGSGSGATDAFLRRTGANALTTDGALTIAGATSVTSTTESTALSVSGGASITKSLTVGGSASLGGAQGVLNMKNVTTAPTAGPSAGYVQYSDTGRPVWTNPQNATYYNVGTVSGSTLTSVSNTTTETTFITATIPGNDPVNNGVYRLTAFGNVTCSATASNMTIRGNVAGGSSSFTLGSTTVDASQANGNWKLEVIIRVTSPGATSNFWLHGTLYQRFSTNNTILSNGSSAGATTDSTTNTAINITAQWGNANASNVLTPKGWFLERMV